MTLKRVLIVAAIVGFLVGWLVGCLYAQAPEAKAIARPIDAAAWALQDSLERGGDDRHVRYSWSPPWINAANAAKVNSFAVNTAISRASVIVHPRTAAKAVLLRWDFSALGATRKDVAELLAVWEQLAAAEPYFSADGKSAYHAGQSHVELSRRLNSKVPIVRHDWLLERILTTTDGGLYYKFQGTGNQNEWLAQFGVDDELAKSVNADQRAAMFRSGVTAKPRRVDFFRGPLGVVSVTHDVADNATRATQHPMRNLLAFQDAAREAIAEKANGLHSFALFDNFGKLQAEAPPTIVADHRVPAPHTNRLEGAISCIRCHGGDGGWKPVRNDVLAMLGNGATILADVSQTDQNDVLQRLATVYQADLEKPLQRARDDYNDAVRRATVNWDAPKVSAELSKQFAAYKYDLVTPEQAALELGLDGDGRRALRYLLPPLRVEDPVIAALLAGIGVNRKDWEAVYAEAADRAIPRFKEFLTHAN